MNDIGGRDFEIVKKRNTNNVMMKGMKKIRIQIKGVQKQH
jgi:hypothetical protein